MTDWSTLVAPASPQLEPFDVEETIAEVEVTLDGRTKTGPKLNWNENLFGPLPGVREAVDDELENGLALPGRAI